MTEKTPKPWITTVPGLPDAITRAVTDEEIVASDKARRRALGTAAFRQRVATDDDIFLESAQSARDFCLLNLRLAEEVTTIADRAVRIRHFREGLARAYLALGEFAAALETVSVAGVGRALPGFAELRAEILASAEAVSRPDDERCGCAVVPEEVVLPTGRTREMSLPFKSVAGRCWSYRHKAVVTINRCNHCGHLNAYSGFDEQIARIEGLRAVGIPVNQGREQFPDHVLLNGTTD